MDTIRPMSLGGGTAAPSRTSNWRICSSRQLERRTVAAARPAKGSCNVVQPSATIDRASRQSRQHSSHMAGAAAIDAPTSPASTTELAGSTLTSPAAFTRAGASAVAKAAAAAAMASRSHPTGRPTVASIPTFQEAISRLQAYWSEVGCAVWLPHNTEVGAGKTPHSRPLPTVTSILSNLPLYVPAPLHVSVYC